MLHIHIYRQMVINTICCTYLCLRLKNNGVQQKPNKSHCIVRKNVFANNFTHIFRCVYYFCLVILSYLFCAPDGFGLANDYDAYQKFSTLSLFISVSQSQFCRSEKKTNQPTKERKRKKKSIMRTLSR